MQAKHGLIRSIRLVGCLMAVALLVGSALASTASAAKTPPTPTAYVALGDSLSFGYKAATFNANKTANSASCEAALTAGGKGEFTLAKAENAKCEPAASFEGGFVGYFGGKLAKTEKKAGHTLATVNLGCPGETSDGLIGHALGKTGGEHEPCQYHNFLPEGAGYPLKTEIGTASQLEAAVGLIATKSAGAVTAVSLQIGSNDELHVVAKCEESAYDAEHGFKSLTECIVHEAGEEGFAYEGGLFKHILTNIGTTIGVLRAAPANYTGKVLLLGFYNPNATLLPGSDALQKVLNEKLEGAVATKAFGEGVELAQPFTLINPEAANYKEGETAKEKAKKEKKEVKAICKYTEMCGANPAPTPSGDIHPTALGYKAIGKLMVKAF
ncbi:MAG: hypothetical protein ACYDC2_07510 [Solirubrobacteraceae bacterium]